MLMVLWAAACGDDAVQPTPEPPNRPPGVTAVLPDLTMLVGETAAIELTAHFSDPDGDALSFAVESDDPAVATATVAAGTLTVVAAGQGTTDVVVTATDPGGLSTSHDFTVTVPNRPPVVADSIPGLEMVTGDSVAIGLSAHFGDPDGDTLSFMVAVSNEGVVLASVTGDTLTVVAVKADTATLVVAATDAGGLSASQAVAVAVVNQAPVVTDSIPELEMVTGDSVAIGLSAYFGDPDGDTLSFMVEVSNEGVVLASVTGDTLTVVAVKADTATLVVAATDAGGLSASQAVAVAVVNQAPVVTDSIPELEMVTGDSVAIGLSAYFGDPDGDTLSFMVEVSNEDVVSASVTGDTLTVVAVRSGAAYVTATAEDPGGLTASQVFGVTVPNHAPTLTDSIPALELFVSDSVDIHLLAHFGDPDGDPLGFAVESSTPEVATASLSGHTMTIAARARGTADITVTGHDPGNLAASQTFGVIVPNRQPEVTESIRRRPLLHRQSITIDLLGHFSDPDGDALEFTTLSSDDAIVSASTSGSSVTVASVGRGTAEISVIARDPGDLSTSQSFVVTVPVNADRDALIALYEATDGPNWNERENWVSRRPLRLWKGVRVNAAGRVTELRLLGNGLTGSIPPELGWLTELTDLTLSGNNLRGAIPPELGRLRALKQLVLRNNSFTGPIPEQLGNLAALTELDLAGNALTGAIPKAFGALRDLIFLELSRNNLTGPLPPELGNLARLRHLWLERNALTGPLPPELGRLGDLQSLWAYDNDLTGSIPPELGRMSSLRDLWLRNNNLTGSIPSELGQMLSLEELDLAENKLTGSIPPQLGEMRSLQDLSLGRNELTGLIPPQLGRLRALTSLGLNDNRLTGPLPSELGALRNLRLTWIHRNRLTGPVPASFGNLRNLEWLNLRDNALTDPLPHSLLRLKKLEFIPIESNDGLCMPGVEAFASWMEVRGERPLCNESDAMGLTALFESTDGNSWTDSQGWLNGPILDQRYGVVTDSAGKVLQLDLRDNGLSGRLPSELGDLLDRLKVLRVGENALSGPIPRSLARLQIDEFDYVDTGLCVPPDESFKTWLDGIPVRRGSADECPTLSDRDILVRLYEATGGENWVNRENWLSDAPLEDWFGVSLDEEGRVARIDLDYNGLAGRLPPELGDFSGLRSLRLRVNNLSGPIPPELGKLNELIELDLFLTKLVGTIPPQLGSLVSLESLNLSSNELTGRIPPELGGLSNLRKLSLSANRLSGSIPAELGRLGRITDLSLNSNRLTGRIPAVLGNLAMLDELDLDNNRLAGTIPPELGNLLQLRNLELQSNQLSGPIPPELGRLTKLKELWLADNALSGPIPPELGRLTNLTSLDLKENDLTGPIPPEIGALSKLRTLWLSENTFTGSVPPELGMLGNVSGISLDGNDLTGSLPPEFGNLSSLEWLDLSLNAGLGGPLPRTLTELGELRELRLKGTDFCVTDRPDLVDWLDGVWGQRMRLCSSTGRAYLTQAVQSREFPVPLVAEEEALLRVFLTAQRVNRESLPPTRATFFVNGREVYRTEIGGGRGSIPTRIDESSLESSANARIPGWVVQPGLEMVIEVDPDGALDPSLGVDRRIPERGRLALDVAEMPPMDLTLIPFLWTGDPDSTIVGMVRAMAADPENHALLWDTRTLLPVNELRITAHEPVLSSTNNAWRLFDQTEAIRALEGGRGHYMGMRAGEFDGPAGLGYTPGRVSFSIPDPAVIAHELGHNMDLLHARCGGAESLDPGFPQIDGSIGAWGYDFRSGRRLVDPLTSDLMSYCDPHWISEYGFSTALHYRLRTEGPEAEPRASPSKSLLLWGGVDTDGNPFLEPTFVVDAPPRLPDTDAGSEYRLEGRDVAGAELFSLTFDMPAVADGEGAGTFAFVLPVPPEWEDALATVGLSGPAGSVALSTSSENATAILLDSRSGTVRAILRELSADPRVQTAAVGGVSVQPGLEVLFSRGIPDAVEWRR